MNETLDQGIDASTEKAKETTAAIAGKTKELLDKTGLGFLSKGVNAAQSAADLGLGFTANATKTGTNIGLQTGTAAANLGVAAGKQGALTAINSAAPGLSNFVDTKGILDNASNVAQDAVSSVTKTGGSNYSFRPELNFYRPKQYTGYNKHYSRNKKRHTFKRSRNKKKHRKNHSKKTKYSKKRSTITLRK